MYKCPQFKPHLQVEVRNGDGVLLLSEMHQSVLRVSSTRQSLHYWMDVQWNKSSKS